MMRILPKLRNRLADYDGRAVTLLGETEAAFGAESGYLDALITLASEAQGHIASGATWLLKSALEQGRSLSGQQVAALSAELHGGLSGDAAWDVQLHICQCVQYLTIPTGSAAEFAVWLEPLLGHRRPFLRAWSLDALFRLSQQHSAYRSDFDAALAVAEQDEAASVRARARKLV